MNAFYLIQNYVETVQEEVEVVRGTANQDYGGKARVLISTRLDSTNKDED